MQKTDITFKPKYNGSMRFALVLWPVWLVLFGYFLYAAAVTQSYNPQGLLTFIFGAMTFTLPLRVFREAHFADEITVKRFLMPALTIQYPEITAFNARGLFAKNGNISLLMMHPESTREFNNIINKLMTEKKIKLKKTK